MNTTTTTSEAPSTPTKAKAPKPAPAPAPRFDLSKLPIIPGRAGAQVHEAARVAALAGLPAIPADELNRLATEAGRIASLAGEAGEGKASAKGGAEASCRWKVAEVCARAGLTRHEPALAAGLALMGAAAAWRKATRK